ncbi:carboxymuconolactone decarboxylase family protein [Alteromonas sp. S167]|uniref:carboxymuconolactone decarboxylase family protein n=1 Tax=Alteromonas sp. S167 TaxID=3117402 RepID=UPI002FE3E04D
MSNNKNTSPAPLLPPLPPETTPELADDFAVFIDILGFIPNSLLTMQRKPEMVKGFAALTKGVMGEGSVVDGGFKRLIAHFASRAAGCQYCEAHSLIAAGIHGISDEKVAAVWEYQTSPLYTQAERMALDFALAAGSVPNAVDAPLMEAMRTHWKEEEIVEILGAVSLYGFLNRWNDSMATEIESSPKALGDEVLAQGGWTGGKHVKE